MTQIAKYADFIKSTGYLTGAGLGGWNCRHSFYAFLPGISEPNYTPEQLADQRKRDAETKPYDFTNRQGVKETRQLTYRDQLDHQRLMERNMRKTRAKAKAFEAAGLNDDYVVQKARYRAQRAEYKKFGNEMGIDLQWERVYIDNLGRI